MKLTDAKPGQRVRRPKWDSDCWVTFGGAEDDTGLANEDGTLAGVNRDDLTADDWQPAETDAQKIARLETELAEAKVHHCRCHCDHCGCPGCKGATP